MKAISAIARIKTMAFLREQKRHPEFVILQANANRADRRRDAKLKKKSA